MKETTNTVCRPGGWPEDAPPRSMLFSLNPEGHSGDNLEDLASYFRRLSEDHCMLPWSLAFRSVVPLVASGSAVWRAKMACYCYGLATSGVTELADSWARALNAATGRNDLQLHTLVPLKVVVPPTKLLSPIERFCPICYADDERSGRPKYNRLLWAIDCVTACPLHNVQLQAVDKSKHDNENPIWLRRRGRRPSTNSFWLPGISRANGRSLAGDSGKPARDEDIRFARLVADLIDDLHHHPHVFQDVGAPTTFLRYAAEVLFAGNLSHFATHLGVSKGALHEWTWGKTRPSLPRLALIAFCCGCAIADVILGNKVMLLKRPAPARAKRLCIRRRIGGRRPRNEFRQEFEQIVASGQASSAREAAELLDVSTKFLRSLSPALNQKVVDAGQERVRRTARDLEELKFSEFRKSFDAIVEKQEKPVRRKVQQDVFERTGLTFGYEQVGVFLKRARRLVDVDLRDEVPGAKGASGGSRHRESRPPAD
ncbi:TniQ family protein [Burkholderia multivorans]|uniref:TniQ family protein n=1 Tax=Burkholderia multivorans TaxID=87883 RepID=UPI0021BECA98|nr:TniQ family protein [Burkholderia multivorans]